MPLMAKKKSAGQPPSRKNTKYVGIPKAMHAILKDLAKEDDRSVNWISQKIIREYLASKGLWPPPQTKAEK